MCGHGKNLPSGHSRFCASRRAEGHAQDGCFLRSNFRSELEIRARVEGSLSRLGRGELPGQCDIKG